MKTPVQSEFKRSIGDVSKESRIGCRPPIEVGVSLEAGALDGEQYEVRLNGATVFVRRFVPEPNARVGVETTDRCYGAHFVLEGSYKLGHAGDGRPLVVLGRTYNMLRWPAKKRILTFGGDRVISVEILFKRGFVEDLLGKSQESVYGHFLDFSENGPDILWETNRPISREMSKVLFKIVDCPYQGSAKYNYIALKVKLLLIDLLLNKGKPGSDELSQQLSPPDRKAIERVVRHIKKNLKKKLTIKELSEIAGFNTTKLKSTFKKVHRTTVFKYITRTRMEKASSLILEKDYSIAQASYEVGYSNPQHFTVAFKKTMGYLPSALLENLR